MYVLLQDVRFALRQLARAPGFTAVAVLTLAIVIGASVAMFSIVRGVLLKPLPYADPDRLVRLYTANPEQDVREGGVSLVDFEDWRARATSFGRMAAYQGMSTFLTGRSNPLELRAVFVTEDFFSVFGMPAEHGRLLSPEDVRQATRTAVISDRLWRSEFSADIGVVGRAVRLGSEPYIVVGVAPPDFRFPTPDTDVWVPYSVLTALEVGPRIRTQRVLQGVGRLADAATLDEARAELSTIAAQLARDYPESNAEWNAGTITPLGETIVGKVDRALVAVSGVVGFMLLIGCTNLVNLLLARGVARSKEVAIRTSLGAPTMRIVRQFLAESLILAVLACVAGVLLAGWGVRIILVLSGDALPRSEEVQPDWPVVAFGFALATGAGLLCGLFPALRTVLASPASDVAGGRGVVGRRAQRLPNILVVAEVSLAVVLVVGSGLMARSFLELRGVDPGFDPDRALAVTVLHNVSDTAPSDVMPDLARRRNEIIDRLAALPGVMSVGATNSLPLEADFWETWEVEPADGGAATDEGLRTDVSYVSPGYLNAMGITLLEGEALPAELDGARGAPVPVLINQTAARRLWPAQNAVGRVLRTIGFDARVVGIVGDVRQVGLAAEPRPALYAPQAMAPRILTTFVIRSRTDALALAGPVREAIRELDPNQPVRRITAMSDVMSESIARDRLFTVLFGMFGGVALALAAVGIYGVLAHSVSQRTQEIAVRLALGGAAGAVLRMVVGSGMCVVVIGVLIGGPAAVLLARVLESQLYGVSAMDPVAFIGALGVLLAAAFLACYVPASRAARVDPIAVLREE